jgi:Fur family ferric uptake transcriptional regulator
MDTLRAQGFKLTSARKAVVEVLCARTMPISVADLIAELAKRGVKADKTTVYREILFMQERGLIEQVQFGDRVKRYELRDDGHHHHLVCVECGSVIDVPLENDMTATEKAIERKTGYKITRHSLEFFGVCRDCR